MRLFLLLLPLLLLTGQGKAAAEGSNPKGFVVQPGDGLSPAETAAGMRVPEGFAVKVFAAEPDIVQPIAFTTDDRGRIWVAENLSYPEWQPEGHDRITILEDSDGDGRCDKKTVFYDKLNYVSAIEVGFGGVWVGSAPNLYFIPDRDGDGIPDGAPEVVLDGWGYQDLHEVFNSFAWGPDGWLYGTQGILVSSKVGQPGTPEGGRIQLNAGVWRLHPQTRKFEVFARGTSNPWGLDWDDFGQCVLTTSVIPHLFHILQGGYYQRQVGAHENPFVYEDLKSIARHRHFVGSEIGAGADQASATAAAGGGHAHAGAMVYLGGTWPAAYRNSVFMCNIHGNRINRDSLVADGSGCAGDRLPDFLLSSDKWFRGLALKYGPDGSVFVSDWYDARACHPQKPQDRRNGRIYKIVYGDVRQAPVDLGKKTSAELVELQMAANDWLVRHARRILQERGPQPAVNAALDAMVADTERTVPQRLRALWALHAAGGLAEARAEELLSDPEPWIQAWSVQFLCEDGPPGDRALAKLVRLSRTSSSQVVRLYLASAAQRIPLEKRRAVLLGLMSRPQDQTDRNLPLMVWYALEPLIGADIGDGAALLEACKLPKVQGLIARRLGVRP